ncbi:tRNA pseudouridine(38-40) synthase TruA [Yaniella halotolerans]|uniref:tRNA pseudouridine(38-40) synthase TruA n=1 Tax=Yaniella halotolerans TaxID=225453 RepID=UPI0003B79EC5|nr:tRNA pseudouridine(38-40) synthase TruA [Yaniella halotolerans]
MDDQTTYRIRIDLAYDGTPYHGWATQPGLPTVQEAVETGLATILRQPLSVTVAGRTDAGVHAANQVIHCDIPQTPWQRLVGNRPTRRPEEALVSKLNGVLARESGAIRILSAQIVPEGFDARFSPLSRQYRYRINNGTPDPLTRHFTYQHRRPLNFEAMAEEIADIQGLYDFGSFCKPRSGATTVRTLHRFDLDVTQELTTVWLAADAFCHHMVRALVGALVQVGDGTRPCGWLQDRLANPVRDSHMMLAPALGLILDTVTYPNNDEVEQRAQQTRARRDPTCLPCD